MPTISASVKSRLLTGMFLLAPLAITIYLGTLLVGVVDRLLTGPMLATIGLSHAAPAAAVWIARLVALAVMLVVLYLVGLVGANLIGRRAWSLAEAVFERIPLVGTVYRAARQVAEALQAGGGAAFRRCVLVEYPRSGVRTLAFVTAGGTVQAGTPPRRCLTVFVPTAPNPTSGFVLFVPEEQCEPLDLSVEQGLKIVVSGGIVLPDHLVAREDGR